MLKTLNSANQLFCCYKKSPSHTLRFLEMLDTSHKSLLFLPRTFCPIFRARLLSVVNPRRIKCTPDNMVLHPWQILHTTATHENNRVLLEIVPLAGYIGNHLNRICQAHLCHLTQRRVRLLRCGRVHTRTNPTPLRAPAKVLATSYSLL